MLDRSTKMLIAVVALVASTFLVINHIVRRDPVEDWLLAGILFLVSVGFWVWMWLEDQAEEQETALTVTTQEPQATQPQEWIISKDKQPNTSAKQVNTAAQAVEKAADAIAKEIDKTDAPVKSTPDKPASATAKVGDKDDAPTKSTPDKPADVITPDSTEDRESMMQDDDVNESAEPVEAKAPKAGDEEVKAAKVVEEIVETNGKSDSVADVEETATPEASAVGEAMAAPQSEDAEKEAEKAKATPKAKAKPSEADDLTKIEGIGPKYSQTLIAAGISTFSGIAASNEEALTKIILDAGMRRPSSISTWVEQATFAAKGDWDGLQTLQDSLTGGRKA
ncbi:MAG: helix-hairpin-helix domain-containing protein [Aggregatilineales bacterium]